MADSGRFWGAGGKSCDGVSLLGIEMMLAGQNHSSSSSKVQQGSEQDSGRLSYTSQNEQLHIQPVKGKMQNRSDEQPLVEASVSHCSDFFMPWSYLYCM